jgi:RNA polymerase sigma-70 factor (ECF subfamily)
MRNCDEIIPTRRSLLSRLKNWDDQDAWRVFFETYWKLIYNAAVRAGLSDAEAQDVVQETVIAVCRNIPEFAYDPAKGSFKTWLMRQTAWRIIGQLRKRLPVEPLRETHRTPSRTTALERVPDPKVTDLEVGWDEEWEKNLVDSAFRRLKAKVDAKHFQIFDLCVRKKWPIAKIAKALRVNPARIYLVKHRLGNLLKKEIEQLKTKFI